MSTISEAPEVFCKKKCGLKETVMRIEKPLIHDRLCVSKVS